MYKYKNTFEFLLISAGGSLVATVISALAGSNLLAVAAASLSLISIVCLWFYYNAVSDSVKSLTASLNITGGKISSSKKVRLLRPLINASNNFTAESIEEIKHLQQRCSELSLQSQLLQRQKSHTEAIIYNIRDVVIVTDASDRLIMANLAAEKLFGFVISEANLKPIDEVIAVPDLVEYVVKSRRGKIQHVRHEITIGENEGQKEFDCVISCVDDDDSDSISGVVSVLHDVTREKEIAKVKNDFVSHVSHELKTPLASINAYAEMLIDGEADSPEEVANFCSVIQGQAQRLSRLIEDILNISRIESGLIKFSKEQLSLTMLICDCYEMIKSFAGEKNITVNTQEPIIFDQVNVDKDMITQVIVNLLSNAVKYTEPGGTVTVNTEVNEIEKIVRVTISDTGVGIAPEKVQHVFDKFYRVDENKKYAKGTGLGLNLVKQIVEKIHNGRVFVSSTLGEGSTFGFDLPMAVNQEVQTA